jgi:hypothetical protein
MNWEGCETRKPRPNLSTILAFACPENNMKNLSHVRQCVHWHTHQVPQAHKAGVLSTPLQCSSDTNLAAHKIFHLTWTSKVHYCVPNSLQVNKWVKCAITCKHIQTNQTLLLQANTEVGLPWKYITCLQICTWINN